MGIALIIQLKLRSSIKNSSRPLKTTNRGQGSSENSSRSTPGTALEARGVPPEIPLEISFEAYFRKFLQGLKDLFHNKEVTQVSQEILSELAPRILPRTPREILTEGPPGTLPELPLVIVPCSCFAKSPRQFYREFSKVPRILF